MTKWNVGDWGYMDAMLVQVCEVREGRVVQVSDGVFITGGGDLGDRLFPQTLPIKRIADEIRYLADRVHRLGFNGMNFPDIRRHFNTLFFNAVRAHLAGGDEAATAICGKATSFFRKVESAVQDLRFQEIDGVRIFGR